jgi:prepilin-type N-terminal cleavage/methylation domain-containing protein
MRVAFTLIEVLVVVVIIAVLASLVAPSVFAACQRSEGDDGARSGRDARGGARRISTARREISDH